VSNGSKFRSAEGCDGSGKILGSATGDSSPTEFSSGSKGSLSIKILSRSFLAS
jgi:hypothetical protein